MSHLSTQFIAEMKDLLLAKQEELTTELKGLSAHTEVGEDDEDNATEVQIDEVNQDVMARINADLVKIEQALEKIDAGTYGVDSDGNEIAEERLRVIPWAEKAI